jgi:hypothetical protein
MLQSRHAATTIPVSRVSIGQWQLKNNAAELVHFKDFFLLVRPYSWRFILALLLV